MKLKNYRLTKYLMQQGITEKELRKNIEEMRGGDRVTSQTRKNNIKH